MHHLMLGTEDRSAVAKIDFLPFTTIETLEEISSEFPGLRWVLRKQRGHNYELRVIRSKHLEEWEVRGEP